MGKIPRLFKPWMSAKGGSASGGNAKLKSRGAVRYFLEWRNIEQADSAEVTCRRITPTSMAKLSFHLSASYLEKANEKRILPYLMSRGKPVATGSIKIFNFLLLREN